jgi:hypothetical protein
VTATATLRRRLDKIAGPEREECPIPDLSVLPAFYQDRFRELSDRLLAGQSTDLENSELYALLEYCPVLGPEGPQKPAIEIPRSLAQYWCYGHRKPSRRSIRRWNYDFALLSFVDRERLMQLCEKYRWLPDSDRVDIAPFDDWRDDDYDELCRLLAATERRPIPK